MAEIRLVTIPTRVPNPEGIEANRAYISGDHPNINFHGHLIKKKGIWYRIDKTLFGVPWTILLPEDIKLRDRYGSTENPLFRH